MPKFKEIPRSVNAVFCFDETVIDGNYVPKYHWLVQYQGRSAIIMPEKQFRDSFMPADMEAVAMRIDSLITTTLETGKEK